MARKCPRMTDSRVASSSLSSSTGSESAPGAFQFAIARTACNVSAYVGSASSDIGFPICDRAPGGGGMFKNLEGTVRRGRGGKEKEWTDCVRSDIRAFGITGDWKGTALKAE